MEAIPVSTYTTCFGEITKISTFWLKNIFSQFVDISSSSSLNFLLTCRSVSVGPPFRYLAHGRSYTRSPVVPIMRVDRLDLPLSVIPFCQLLPCYLWPLRPTFSINLYVTGRLDCTIRAFHVSMPAEPSLPQDEVQVFNAKWLIEADGENVLRLDIAVLSDHCLSFCWRRWRFGFVNGQVSLAWSIALHTQELYTW